jgi:YfiH family protein
MSDYAWTISTRDSVELLTSDLLDSLTSVQHGMTTRHQDRNLSFYTHPDPTEVRRHRAEVCAVFGKRLTDLTVPSQRHGNGVAVVDETYRGRGGASHATAIAGMDALVTATPGLLLGITIADCLPVFLADRGKGVIGLAHSGWRGTAGEIVPHTLELMRKVFGTEPQQVVAAIGAGIGGCCYEVGAEVREALLRGGSGEEAFRPSPAGRWLLNLQQVVVGQLLAFGVPQESISCAPYCTSCRPDLFFSHRRDGARAGRMGAFLMLR